MIAFAATIPTKAELSLVIPVKYEIFKAWIDFFGNFHNSQLSFHEVTTNGQLVCLALLPAKSTDALNSMLMRGL